MTIATQAVGNPSGDVVSPEPGGLFHQLELREQLLHEDLDEGLRGEQPQQRQPEAQEDQGDAGGQEVTVV